MDSTHIELTRTRWFSQETMILLPTRLELSIAPSGSQALLFDVHYDGVFFFLPPRLHLDYNHMKKKDAGNMSYEELLGWAGEEVETMYSPSIKPTSPSRESE
nr:hypothetical protein [Tanacetum cinerariifolium]